MSLLWKLRLPDDSSLPAYSSIRFGIHPSACVTICTKAILTGQSTALDQGQAPRRHETCTCSWLPEYDAAAVVHVPSVTLFTVMQPGVPVLNIFSDSLVAV